MPKENITNRINHLVLEEFVRIAQNTTLAPHQAWRYALRVMVYRRGVNIRAHTIHNPWKLSRIVGEEYLLVLKSQSLSPRLALRLAIENSATSVALDPEIVIAALMCFSRKIQTHWHDRDYPWENISSDKNQSNLARRQTWHTHRRLFEAVLKILYDYDPIGIPDHHECPTEYSLEVNNILPHLEQAYSENDVWQIVYEEFVRCFGNIARRSV